MLCEDVACIFLFLLMWILCSVCLVKWFTFVVNFYAAKLVVCRFALTISILSSRFRECNECTHEYPFGLTAIHAHPHTRIRTHSHFTGKKGEEMFKLWWGWVLREEKAKSIANATNPTLTTNWVHSFHVTFCNSKRVFWFFSYWLFPLHFPSSLCLLSLCLGVSDGVMVGVAGVIIQIQTTIPLFVMHPASVLAVSR